MEISFAQSLHCSNSFVFDGLIPQTCAIAFVWIYSALGRSGDQKKKLSGLSRVPWGWILGSCCQYTLVGLKIPCCLCNGNFEMAILAGIRERVALAPTLEKPQYYLSQLFLSLVGVAVSWQSCWNQHARSLFHGQTPGWGFEKVWPASSASKNCAPSFQNTTANMGFPPPPTLRSHKKKKKRTDKSQRYSWHCQLLSEFEPLSKEQCLSISILDVL